MSTEFVERTVKIEEGTENVTEIQSYLAGFQKEIGDSSLPSGAVVIATQGDEADEDQDGEEGTYFVDQAGHYYFQAKGDSDPKPVIMSAVPQHNGEDYMDVQESEDADEQDEAVPVVPNTASNQILINSGNAYQRVTMVPEDGGSGELSYVLIVQDPDIKDGVPPDEDQDMAVYDFDDQEGSVQLDSDEEDDKSKIVKIVSRKTTQTATQALHMCNYCNYTSSKRYLLSRHMKSHSEERPHKCSVCERGFKTIASLQNHINTHTGTKPHLCKFCEAAFTTSGELVRHVRYRHTHEKPHKCTECDYASVELSKLKRHIRCHTGERPYQCPHCTYASPDTFKLKRHLRIHTGEKPYECEICAARFTQSNSLKAHRLTHNAGDRPVFQCEMCPTTCGRKTDLRIHVQKLHTSDKPIKCRRCGKTFPDRYSYKMHSKSHEGEKCFKCDLCPYASASPRHLESHMLIHTDQKPYECDLCDQSFRQKQLLKRHQNLYHNPEYIPPKPKEKNHECPDCKRPFRHKGNLIRHMAAHDPDPLIQRKNLELKLGRQKKIQMVDGQQVDMMNSSFGSDEEDEIDMMAMEASDGQQYVVLEVIQLADGEEQAMVVSGDTSGSIVGMDGVMQNSGLDDDVIKALQSARSIDKSEEEEDKKPIIPSTETDMQNCFGFDEEEEDDQQRDSLTDFL